MWRGRADAKEILDDPGVREALPRYVEIVRGKAYPKYLIADSYEGRFRRSNTTEELWEIHEAMLEGFKSTESSRKPKKVPRSFLELKLLSDYTS